MSAQAEITFPTYSVGINNVNEIGATAATLEEPVRPGVITEIKTVFGYEGDDLRGLIGHVAPHKTLQDNTEFAKEKLSAPGVQELINYPGKSAGEIANDWGRRTGLQAPVYRPFMFNPAGAPNGAPYKFDVAIIPERVPNWLERMADSAIRFSRAHRFGLMALASSEREIGPDETPGVEAGTSAESYMQQAIVPRLESGRIRTEVENDRPGVPNTFDSIELLKTGGKNGDEVMANAANMLADRGIDLPTAKIIVFSVAGNWMQTGAQARVGLQSVEAGFDANRWNPQLYVVSDSFPLGITGEEPKTTHQNPFSAIGNILRGAMLLDETPEYAPLKLEADF
jgi:hypothetical protein